MLTKRKTRSSKVYKHISALSFTHRECTHKDAQVSKRHLSSFLRSRRTNQAAKISKSSSIVNTLTTVKALVSCTEILPRETINFRSRNTHSDLTYLISQQESSLIETSSFLTTRSKKLLNKRRSSIRKRARSEDPEPSLKVPTSYTPNPRSILRRLVIKMSTRNV